MMYMRIAGDMAPVGNTGCVGPCYLSTAFPMLLCGKVLSLYMQSSLRCRIPETAVTLITVMAGAAFRGKKLSSVLIFQPIKLYLKERSNKFVLPENKTKS